MVLKEISGSLLDSGCNVICHQVNCRGFMVSETSKAIKREFPRAFEQYSWFLRNNLIICDGRKLNSRDFLGLCQIVKTETGKYVANLFGQDDFGNTPGKVYTDYDALLCSLFALRRLVLFGGYNIKSIAFPYGLGSDAGSDWTKVKNLIIGTFKDLDITVEIRK